MTFARNISIFLIATAASFALAQDDAQPESRRDIRYSLSVIEDATQYGNRGVPEPKILNQLLVEPYFAMHYKPDWSFASSVVGIEETYSDTVSKIRVKETYLSLSARDFDWMAGRKIVRWGTGYAFSPTGVLDPPRDPTNPTDRLNLNQGRDMVNLNYIHGPHALSLAWSTAALAPSGSDLRDTTAVRYNVLTHGFDTSLIAGDDHDGDAFGGLTMTRVIGQAWELHVEAAWREHEALLSGAKYITKQGISFIGEFYTAPNITYFRSSSSVLSEGRLNYGFLSISKSRLRELPEWKQWDLSASLVTNLDDRSTITIFDATRRFGKHTSGYLHMEIPAGSRTSEYGMTPYSTATSVGIRFQL